MAKSPKKIILRVLSIVFGICFLVGTYRSISSSYQATPEQQITVAEARVKEKKWDEALAALAEARKKAPHNYRIDFLEGNIYRAQRDLPKALASFEAAHAKKPDDAKVLQLIGITQLALKQPEKAETAFLKAVKAEPASARAHTNLGVYYNQVGKQDKAIAALEQAVKVRPNFGEAHHILGNLYKERKDIPKAREHYEAFLARKPKIPVQDKIKLMLWLKKHQDPNKPKPPVSKAHAAKPGQAESKSVAATVSKPTDAKSVAAAVSARKSSDAKAVDSKSVDSQANGTALSKPAEKGSAAH